MLAVHECQCAECQQPGSSHTKELHTQLNLFLSTLTGEQKTWFLARESANPNCGGDLALELITGVRAVVIAKSRWALQLADHSRQRAANHIPRGKYAKAAGANSLPVDDPLFLKSKRRNDE